MERSSSNKGNDVTMTNCREILRKLTNELLEKNEKLFNASLNEFEESFTVMENAMIQQNDPDHRSYLNEPPCLETYGEDKEEDQGYDRRDKLLEELRSEGDRMLNEGPPSLMVRPVIEAINSIIAAAKSTEKTDDDFFEAIQVLSDLINFYDADCHQRLLNNRDKLDIDGDVLERDGLQDTHLELDYNSTMDRYTFFGDEYDNTQCVNLDAADLHTHMVDVASSHITKKLDRYKLLLERNLSNDRQLLRQNERLHDDLTMHQANHRDVREMYLKKLDQVDKTYNELLESAAMTSTERLMNMSQPVVVTDAFHDKYNGSMATDKSEI